jgi:hypothetical protein
MQDKKKRSYEVSQKFQESWALKFPWVEIIQRKDGGVHHVVVCVVAMCENE